MSFVARFWLAYVVFFKVLFDGFYAKRIATLHPPKTLPEAVVEADTQAELEKKLGADDRRIEKLEADLKALKSQLEDTKTDLSAAEASAQSTREDGALWLLGLLQKQGRFVDFLQQDIAGFDDADVSGAARVIHDGCRQQLRKHFDIEPIRTETEGSQITLEAGYDARAVKLTGDVAGAAPYTGALRHAGWRATRAELRKLVGDHDAQVLAQAELEL